MLRSFTLLSGALALLLAVAPASAQTPFLASLSGANEVPPVTTAATGTVVGTLDGTTLVVTGEFSGLESAYAASHIHQAAAGSNGGVVVALSPTVDADGFGGTFPAANNTFTLTPTQVAALESENFYINIHSANNGGGEIRGQLVPAAVGGGGDLALTAIFDGPRPGGLPKGVELYVVNDIPDLSVYGLGSATNGQGSGGVEFVMSGAATAGQFLYVATDVPEFTAFFGFAPTLTDNVVNINGDDAVELFYNAAGLTVAGTGTVVDAVGDPNVDGSNTPWDHLDGWGYRVNGAGPSGAFVQSEWTFSGINQLEGGLTNATTTSPVPVGTYSPGGAGADPTVSLSSGSATADEGGQVTITAILSFAGAAPNGNPVTVGLTLAGASTATAADFTGPTPATASFTGSTDGEQVTFTVDLVENDGVEGNETATFDLGVTAGTATVGTPSVFNLTIADTDVPPLATIAAARAQGVGANVTLLGVVSRARGAFSYIQDATGGMTVRQTSGAWFDAVANGTIAPGTVVEVTGTLSQFNSLMQINGADLASFQIGTSPLDPVSPQTVTLAQLEANGEDYEAELVFVTGVAINAGGATDFAPGTTYMIMDGSSVTNAVALRTPSANDTQIPGSAIPAWANVTAVVGQFSSNDPAAGYQLLVIDTGDIQTAVASEANGEAARFAIESIRPNPVVGAFAISFSLDTPGAVRLSVVDVLGREVALLADGEMEAREHTLSVPSDNLAPGTYLVRLESNGSVASRTMTVVR